jgi:hypothetical protein
LQEGIASLKGDTHWTFVNTLTVYTFIIHFVGRGRPGSKAKPRLDRKYGWG